MNATELTGENGDFKFKDIFTYMSKFSLHSSPYTLAFPLSCLARLTLPVPISFVVITTSLFLAFSKMTRAILSFVFSYAWAYTITKIPIYTYWHDFKWRDKHMSSKTLKEQEIILVNGMKAKALRKKAEKIVERRLAKEGTAREEIMSNGFATEADRAYLSPS